MGRTSRFVNSARSLVKSIKNGHGDRVFLDMYEPFSKGRCFSCNERVYVDDVIKSGSGIEYRLRCGHTVLITDLPKHVSSASGFTDSRVGINAQGLHDVHMKVGGQGLHKTVEEIAVVKTFCHNFEPKLDGFLNDEEYSPVDVIAKSSKDGATKLFQVTRMADQSFWAELHTHKSIDRVIPEISDLVKQAVSRKSKYDKKQRERITLLIDAKPGVMHEISEKISSELYILLKSSGFQAIWVVGSMFTLTHQIFPNQKYEN